MATQGGFDLSGPSAQEEAYGKYGSQLAAPGKAEGYNAQYGGQFAAPGGAQQFASNPNGLSQAKAGTSAGAAYAQANPALQQQSAQERFAGQGSLDQSRGGTASGQYWQGLQGGANMPAADMSAYYNRAQETGSAQIDKAAAARGMYGSTAALDQQRQLSADLGGQRARDEAQYGLQRAGLQDNIMGGAAARADQSGLGAYGAQLNAAQASDQGLLGRLGLGGNLAGGADQAGLSSYLGQFGVQQGADQGAISRFNAGMGGAQASDSSLQSRLGLLGQGAQSADAGRTGRIGMAHDALAGITGATGQMLGGAYTDMFATDQGYMDMGQQLSLGAGNQALQGSIANVAGTAAQGAQATQIGAANDQAAQQVLLSSLNK
jgi:hypothetical protein